MAIAMAQVILNYESTLKYKKSTKANRFKKPVSFKIKNL